MYIVELTVTKRFYTLYTTAAVYCCLAELLCSVHSVTTQSEGLCFWPFNPFLQKFPTWTKRIGFVWNRRCVCLTEAGTLYDFPSGWTTHQERNSGMKVARVVIHPQDPNLKAEAKSCICNTDGCNHAGAYGPSIVLLFAGILTAIIYAYADEPSHSVTLSQFWALANPCFLINLP